ncbi:zinc finger Ran-binding domain-containing protein [Trifolium repens]|nr:zinc finger Ran-binding domain-containing protein [Trifolium repens]
MSRPGDWNCRTCNHLNFQRRESCQRCGESRLISSGADFGAAFVGGRGSTSPFPFTTGPDVRPGDWYCTVGNCGAHNFASRSSHHMVLEAAAAVPLLALAGNPVIGYAPGPDVTSITLLIEWSVTDAMARETLVPEDLPIYLELHFSIIWFGVEEERIERGYYI